MNQSFDGSHDFFEVISHSNREVVVVDSNQMVLWMSSGVEHKVLSTQSLKVIRQKLVVEDSEQGAELDNIVKQACSLSAKDKNRCGFMSMHIGGIQYALSVFSSAARISLFSDSARVAVLVFQDPLSVNVPKTDVLGNYLGLTPAESKLCIGLVKGYSLNEYAALTGLSIHTVRSSLKLIMAKADVRKQTELIQLLRGLS